MLKTIAKREFTNGVVYALQTEDGRPIEVTDTFLPSYTKTCINEHSNTLKNEDVGDRSQRWMIGISTMFSCPVRCNFCATGQLKGFRNLTAEEMLEQVDFVVNNNPNFTPQNSFEFKINLTRMGEPFLNIINVRQAIELIQLKYPNAHCLISTIGIKGADFSWIKGNVTLQVSLHSCVNERRNNLIPFKNKMTIEELGQIRTDSNLKTTLNMTLVDNADFDINVLTKNFDSNYFFIKLSPINKNATSVLNNMGDGIIHANNLV